MLLLTFVSWLWFFEKPSTCGGSSGGEAAIIAGGGSPLGLGTDFDGSVRAISKNGDEREFISISKGFDRDDNRKFKQILTIPFDTEVVRELVDDLQSVA